MSQEGYSKLAEGNTKVTEGQKVSVTLHVEGITCADCAARLESRLLAHPAIVAAAVNSITNKADVTYTTGMSEASLLREVVAAGFVGEVVARGSTARVIFSLGDGTTTADAERAGRALAALPGVATVVVDVSNLQVKLEYAPETTSARRLMQELKAMGFPGASLSQVIVLSCFLVV